MNEHEGEPNHWECSRKVLIIHELSRKPLNFVLLLITVVIIFSEFDSPKNLRIFLWIQNDIQRKLTALNYSVLWFSLNFINNKTLKNSEFVISEKPFTKQRFELISHW
jgi:hypothetical protein